MRQMNVQSIPTASDRINELRMLTAEIVNREILPNENVLWAEHRSGVTLTDHDRELSQKLRESVRTKVRQTDGCLSARSRGWP